MKYGKGTNKGMLKVHRKCSTATVKVRLHSTELVRLRKACFNCTLCTLSNVWKLLYLCKVKEKILYSKYKICVQETHHELAGTKAIQHHYILGQPVNVRCRFQLPLPSPLRLQVM